jgi:hypothetical protein
MPRGQLSVITPPSTSTQRRNEVAEVTPTKNPSSSTKQSQERHQPHRRSKRSRPGHASSHRVSSRSSDQHLDFVNAQSLDLSWSRTQWYVNDFIPDDPSKHTFSCNTDTDTAPNQAPPVPGSSQSNLPEPSGHTADSEAAPERKSNWMSTASATTKLAINVVKESSDVLPPLKSVAGGLSAILNHYEVHSIPSRLYRP